MIRKSVIGAALAVVLVACADRSTSVIAPNDVSLAVAQASAAMFGSDAVGSDAPDAGMDQLWAPGQLPDSIKLTSEQQAAITALVTAFHDQNAPLIAQLDAIRQEAVAAHKAGATMDQVKAILAKGAAIHQQLDAAQAALKQAIAALLTPAQLAWLAAHGPKVCDPHVTPPLTDAQKAQIKALVDAFNTANAADIAAVKAAHQAADSARHAGASEAAVKAILDAVKPALDRLHTATETSYCHLCSDSECNRR